LPLFDSTLDEIIFPRTVGQLSLALAEISDLTPKNKITPPTRRKIEEHMRAEVIIGRCLLMDLIL